MPTAIPRSRWVCGIGKRQRSLKWWAVALALGLGASSLCEQSTASAGTASPTLAQRYAKAVSDALSQSTVAWTSVIRGSASTTTFVSITGRSSGMQQITLSKGLSGHLELVLSKNTLYAKGDFGGLLRLLGLTGEAANEEASKWISIPSGSPLFASQAEGLTIKTLVAGISLTGPFTDRARRRVNGVEAVGLQGMTQPTNVAPASPAVLFVSDNRRPLPVRASQTSQGITNTISYLHWDVHIVVNPPTTSVPLQASWVGAS